MLKCINIAVEVLPEYVNIVALFHSCMQRYVGSCFIKIFFFGFVYPVNFSEVSQG